MAILTNKYVDLPKRYVPGIFGDITAESAFQRASTEVPLTGEGITTRTLGDVSTYRVDEGGVKTVSNPNANPVDMLPQKWVTVSIVSDEFLDDEEVLANEVSKKHTKSQARAFDAEVAGTATIAGFSTLGKLPASQIGDVTDLIGQIGRIAGNDAEVTGYVMSTAHYYALLGQRLSNGAKAYNIENGTIEGVPYYLFQSSQDIGFLGDFKNHSAWGRVGSVKNKIDGSGTIGGVNLLETNQKALFTETRSTFVVDNNNAFAAVSTQPVVIEP